MSKTRLASLKSVRLEMNRVYDDSRAGVIPAGDGSKLNYQLSQIAAVIRDELVEGRLSRLEVLANELADPS